MKKKIVMLTMAIISLTSMFCANDQVFVSDLDANATAYGYYLNVRDGIVYVGFRGLTIKHESGMRNADEVNWRWHMAPNYDPNSSIDGPSNKVGTIKKGETKDITGSFTTDWPITAIQTLYIQTNQLEDKVFANSGTVQLGAIRSEAISDISRKIFSGQISIFEILKNYDKIAFIAK